MMCDEINAHTCECSGTIGNIKSIITMKKHSRRERRRRKRINNIEFYPDYNFPNNDFFNMIITISLISHLINKKYNFKKRLLNAVRKSA